MTLFGVIKPWLTPDSGTETSMNSYICNKYKHTDNCSKNTCVFQAVLWLIGISGLICVFYEGSVKLKTKPEGSVNTNFSRHLYSDGSHLGGRRASLVWVQNNDKDFTLNPIGTHSGCGENGYCPNSKSKKRVKVHIYILYIEHSWAISHIMVA